MAYKMKGFGGFGNSPLKTHTTGVPHSESGWKSKKKTTNGKNKKMQAYEGAQHYTHPTKDNEGFKTMQVSSGTGKSDADRYVIQYKPGEGSKAYEEFKTKNPNIKLDKKKDTKPTGLDTDWIFQGFGGL